MPEVDIVSDLSTSTELPINGKPYTFIFLNTYDKAAFVREYRRIRKAQMLENMKTAGTTDRDQMMVDLEDFDDNPPDDWIGWLNKSEEGQLYACRLSLAKTYPAEAETLIKGIAFSAQVMADLIIKLFGTWVSRKTTMPTGTPAVTNDMSTYGDGGALPNDPAPEVYGTPAEVGMTNDSSSPK